MYKPILAHMNPTEIQELMQLQESVLGTQPKFTAGGVPDFSDLEEVFSDPGVSDYTMQHMRKKMAEGGHAIRDDFDIMRKSGRFGDTKMAYLPLSLANSLDNVLGRSTNPITGKREYFIGALLGGLSSMLPSIMPSLGRMLPSLGGLFGGGAGSAAASGMGRAAMGSMGGGGGGMFSGLMNTLSNPNFGGALQNIGGIAQLAAPLFGMFGGGQQQQQQGMPMQQPQQSSFYGGAFPSVGYGQPVSGFGAQGNPHDVMMDLGMPGNTPFSAPQSSYAQPQYYGMNAGGQRMNPSQYSNYGTMVPYRASMYPPQPPRYMR